jgi:hypothetical protein
MASAQTHRACITLLLLPACAGWLNTVAPYFLAPLFGLPSGAYRLHHVVMHHIEDNAAGWDLSATEGFQRDSLAHFARCVALFCFGPRGGGVHQGGLLLLPPPPALWQSL